jgi:poly(3-hydroxybutyrate) depolymerase
VTKTKWRILAFVSVILIIHAASVSCTHSRVQESSKGNFTKSLPHNGLKGTYRLLIPSSYRESIAAPPLLLPCMAAAATGIK